MDKPRGRPFERGNKMGRGRPKGSPNRQKSEGQRVLDEFAPHLIRKCIAMALQGDRGAMRLCMERTSPLRRGGFVAIKLPATRTAKDVDQAAEKVICEIQKGKLTLDEGAMMMNTLKDRARVIETARLEGRIDEIEERIKGKNDEGNE
jgi:hypothetical protein